MGFWAGFGRRLIRRKQIDLATVGNSQLARVLTLLDLTALGIGSTLGAGIYVVAGHVAREVAGPAVVLSFLIAAVASVMAGLCYAEFGSRVPKTGSAYVYSYVTVGELLAFIIGWNLILEYVIGTASVARAWSANFDALINNTMQNYFLSHVPMNLPGLSAYPDIFALGITLALAVILAVGVKESTTFNNIFTGVNLLVVLYVIICGLFKVDIKNWTLPVTELPEGGKFGTGGFFPFGFGGMMSGAATCFYAFVGFDCIATTGEEAIHPERNIPLSIIISLLAIFMGYFGISCVLTLMVPYFLLDPHTPLPAAFKLVGWDVAKYIIAVGSLCGLSTSLLGAMFPMPRVIYAMAGDGVIFRFLSSINSRFKTPVIATMVSGALSGVMASLFDLNELVDMMSIGTLLAYTLVAISVLIIRYRVHIYAGKETLDLPSAPPLPSSALPAPQVIPLYMQESALPGAGTKPPNEEDDRVENNHEGDSTNQIQAYSQEYVEKQKNDQSRLLSPPYAGSPPPYPGTYSVPQVSPLTRLFNPQAQDPTAETQKTVIVSVGIVSGLIIAFSAMIIYLEPYIADVKWWAILPVTLVFIMIVLTVVVIARQPQNKAKVNFKVPFLPVLPILSSFINIYLMLKLSSATWIRFGVWMFIGFLVYFTYGIRHSSLSLPPHDYIELDQHSTEDEVETDSSGNK